MAFKISPAQIRALMTGFTNEEQYLTGRPATLNALVREGLAYALPVMKKTRWTIVGHELAEEFQQAERAEQFKADAAAVEELRPEGTRPVYARDLAPGMIISTGAGFRSVEAVVVWEDNPYEGTHWTRVVLAPAVDRQSVNERTRTSQPRFIYFVAEDKQPCPGCGAEAGKPCKDPLLDLLSAVDGRPAAEVLAVDPIPADNSVLEAMPGEKVGRDGIPTLDAVTHEAYVVQIRDKGTWILPNHDDGAHLTRSDVSRGLAWARKAAPERTRITVDTDGTVYVSTGWSAARYLPVRLFSNYSADVCPGCDTPYATNGDGPCVGGFSTPIAAEKEPESESDFPSDAPRNSYRVTIDVFHRNGGRISGGTTVVRARNKAEASKIGKEQSVARMIAKNSKVREEMERTGLSRPLGSEDPAQHVVVDVRVARKTGKAGA